MQVSFIVDIVAVLAIAGIVFLYTKRGLIGSIFRFAKLILAVLISRFAGPWIGEKLNSAFIGEKMYGFVSGKVGELCAQLPDAGADTIASSFPDFLMTDAVRERIASAAEGQEGEAFREAVSRSISEPIASAVSNVIGYLLAFLISFVLLTVLLFVLSHVIDRIPVLGTVNHVCGALLGVVLSLIFLLIVSSLMKAIFSDVYGETKVVRFFGDSVLPKFGQMFDLGGLWFS